MKFCQPHWDALRESVKAHKLWRFVPETGQEAHENMVLELQGQGATFDPLMGAMWQLTEQVMDNIKKSQGPIAALQAFGDPDWCPMCSVQAAYDAFLKAPKEETASYAKYALDAQGWIDRKLDGAVAYVREQGWKLDGEQ